ncbi:hypothetical protein LEP1GSC158_0614 [Leptospira interrogans serovar Zanoni str. LT2156]|uniref:Uncharacterized protein n=1 Tax=Leptospira interrogans serovar Zanoni str. LT2156 TaxID=1001601 RepID=M6HAX9_LEPIR|nr:hypothetical protein LEP1GSC158_0614 [Leptospira interrogans serovar Zanoni str. LT2156]
MFLRNFHRVMEEDKGGEGQGGAGEGGGANEEFVELNIAGTSHKVPKAVAQAFGSLNKNLRTMESDYKTLKDTATSAKGEEYQELLAKFQELELEKLPEKEREAIRLNGEVAKLKGLHEVESKNSARYKSLFYENAIQTAINAALSSHELYDAEQTSQLLRVYGKPALIEDTNGGFKVVLNMDFDGNGVQEFDPKEGAAKWLGLSKNANLLKNNLNPGAGTPSGGKSGPGGSRVFTPESWQREFSNAKDENARKELMQKVKSGEYVVKTA